MAAGRRRRAGRRPSTGRPVTPPSRENPSPVSSGGRRARPAATDDAPDPEQRASVSPGQHRRKRPAPSELLTGGSQAPRSGGGRPRRRTTPPPGDSAPPEDTFSPPESEEEPELDFDAGGEPELDTGEEPELGTEEEPEFDTGDETGLETADDELKFDKEEVAYGPPPPDRIYHTCSKCVHFIANEFACELVKGTISPDDYCTEWEENPDSFTEPTVGIGNEPGHIRLETTMAGHIGTGPDIRLGDVSAARSKKSGRGPRDPMITGKKRRKRKRRKR